MKRLLCVAVIAVLLVSCAHGQTGDPLSVFEGNFEAKISSQLGEGRCEYIYKSADKSIEFTYPDEISGFVLKADSEGTVLSYDGISVSVSEYAGRLILLCESVFSKSAKDVTGVTAGKTGSGTVTVVKTVEYTYTFSSDGAPTAVSGIFADIPFEMTLLGFTAGGEGK